MGPQESNARHYLTPSSVLQALKILRILRGARRSPLSITTAIVATAVCDKPTTSKGGCRVLLSVPDFVLPAPAEEPVALLYWLGHYSSPQDNARPRRC